MALVATRKDVESWTKNHVLSHKDVHFISSHLWPKHTEGQIDKKQLVFKMTEVISIQVKQWLTISTTYVVLVVTLLETVLALYLLNGFFETFQCRCVCLMLHVPTVRVLSSKQRHSLHWLNIGTSASIVTLWLIIVAGWILQLQMNKA